MNCDACGFDMGDSLGDSGRCAGCGTPLGPAKDHDRPAPGFNVHEEDPNFTPSEEDIERYPELDGVLAIIELDVRWGRGIGAETYGYYTKKKVETRTIESCNVDHDECPECGGKAAKHYAGFDGCVAGYDYLECVTCEFEFRHDQYC